MISDNKDMNLIARYGSVLGKAMISRHSCGQWNLSVDGFCAHSTVFEIAAQLLARDMVASLDGTSSTHGEILGDWAEDGEGHLGAPVEILAAFVWKNGLADRMNARRRTIAASGIARLRKALRDLMEAAQRVVEWHEESSVLPLRVAIRAARAELKEPNL